MAIAVFDRFTGAAPEKSLGRTKPGAQRDSRRYQLPITDRSRRCRRLLITDYRLPFPALPAIPALPAFLPVRSSS
jgi:hypothetical protein